MVHSSGYSDAITLQKLKALTMTNREDLTEPSDVERGEWLDVTRTYVEGLEDILDAQAKQLRIATEALEQCRDEIDDYIRQEYPLDHKLHERYRQRDFAVNPARTAINKMKEKE